jgi:hypothetical protein
MASKAGFFEHFDYYGCSVIATIRRVSAALGCALFFKKAAYPESYSIAILPGHLNEFFVSVLRLNSLSILLILSFSVQASQEEPSWSAEKLSVAVGTVIDVAGPLKVQANEYGQIRIVVDARGILLGDFSKVGVTFGEVPSGSEYFVSWITTNGTYGTRELFVSNARGQPATVSMLDIDEWGGSAEKIGLGINLPPYGIVSVESIVLLRQNVFSRMTDHVHGWSSFRPWALQDVNFYTGTATPDQGYYPAPFFAGILLVALLGYIIYLLAVDRLRQFDWRVFGAITLMCWIALDLLWQVRIGQQARATYVTFAGKSAEEKLLASGDAPIVRFVTGVKASIEGKSPRIFLASSNDYSAMLSAYYIAPLNTYWHRKGPELPDRSALREGDYVLLVAPFTTPYLREQGTIVLPDSSSVPVELVLRDPMGLLLRLQ